MKIVLALAVALFATACSAPSNQAPTADASAPAPAPIAVEPTAAPAATDATPASDTDMPPMAAVSASARGVVDAIDVAGKTLVISHEAVASLDWPPMTMSFKAPAIDLGALKKGDKIQFDFSSVGMDGTVTKLERVK